MRLAVAASPEVAIPTLEALLGSSHELVSVISQPDRPAGRGKVLTPTPVSEWALAHQLPLLRPDSKEEIAAAVEGVDCVVTIGYGVLLPESILSIPRHGFLNLHFSLLPRWRGAAPVQRSIEASDAVTGVTVFQLDAGMDTGPIYSMKRFALDSDITSDELLTELGLLGVEAVQESLIAIENGVRPTPQSSVGATRAKKISKDECEIDWKTEAKEISQKIRAFTSNPGAWTTFRGAVVKIDSIIISGEVFPAGTLHILNNQLLVGTGSTALAIGYLTPAGKSRMDAKSWLNGARISDGDFFG